MSCKKRWFILGVFAAVFCSWSKESFTLVLPFIPLLVIVYDLLYIDEFCVINKENVLKSIKKNRYLLISLWGVFLWNMYQILFKFGVDFGGYAGIDESLGMFDRYFIPTTVAVALIAIIVVYDVLKDFPKVLLGYEIVVSCILTAFIVFALLPYANEYAEGGKNIEECFSTVCELADKNSIIIADIDPECNLAVESYLECQMEFTSVFSIIEDEVVDLKNIHEVDRKITELNEAYYILSSDKRYVGYNLIVKNDSISLWEKK